MLSCGGAGPANPPSAEEKQKLESVLRQNLEKHLGSTPSQINVVSVSRQVVAGTNYFAKVHVGGDDYIHARIYEPLPHTGQPLELHSIQKGKSLGDAVAYF